MARFHGFNLALVGTDNRQSNPSEDRAWNVLLWRDLPRQNGFRVVEMAMRQLDSLVARPESLSNLPGVARGLSLCSLSLS
jgi:hypothetical protein